MVSSTLVADASTTTYMNLTQDTCAVAFQDFNISNAAVFCNWTWDTIMCWPPTPANSTIKQRCPNSPGVDSSKYAERRCSSEGKWEINPSVPNPNGWTNYTSCFTPETQKLLKEVDDDKIAIAEKTRILEMVGFSISLAALLISLVIFFQFRTLRNNRTKIHKNLFIAMVVQVIIRMIRYIDHAILRSSNSTELKSGINITPILCESSIVLLEYAKTAMFMWMFIEGLYLHNVVTVTVFQGRFPHKMYIVLGWGGPIIMTAIWAVATAKYMKAQRCWHNYNLTPYYWILEGPRLGVIILNLIFLLNIIRVLIVKLRQSHTSDIEQARRAVRAAIVLLPLLGITNALNMISVLDRPTLEFAIWSYTTHFLTSFQGFFISLLYCFLNGEVRAALLRSLSIYMSIRGHHDWVRRPSMFSAAYYNTAADTEAANYAEVLDRYSQVNKTNDQSERTNEIMQCNVRCNTVDGTTTSKPEVNIKNNAMIANENKTKWINLCFRTRKESKEPERVIPESVVFDLSE